jgi:hypothetical protein
MSKYDIVVDVPLKEFDAVLRFARTDRDGVRHDRQFVVRFPSADFETAEQAAYQIAYAIVENLPKSEDNNRYGWKMAGDDAVGTIAEA